MWAISLWGTHLNLPQVRFKCWGGRKRCCLPVCALAFFSTQLAKTKTSDLNQSLTCADFGIYIATCVICHEQYVGQTSNTFSKIWSAHRSNWNKQDCKTDSDKDQMVAALFREPRHYKQANSARSIHRYFCRTTKLSLSGYL